LDGTARVCRRLGAERLFTPGIVSLDNVPKPMKQVICMKWGGLYGAAYVNKLYAMTRRNVSGDLRFVCLTDDRSGIRPEVECHDCPEVDIPDPHRLRGWRKVSLFAEREGLFGLDGDWLYLDLDVVVVGRLDDFFSFEPDRAFIVMRNWTQPGKDIGNTSVYRFRVGANPELLKNLLAGYRDILTRYRNSQTYISRNVSDLNFWPDDWCVLFKTHCVPAWPRRFWVRPHLPEKARVVAFPGVPNPHQAVKGEWPCRGYKRIYKFIRPASWIEDYWHD
jgi:hypothetical protein